jgi:hypothetical protein
MRGIHLTLRKIYALSVTARCKFGIALDDSRWLCNIQTRCRDSGRIFNAEVVRRNQTRDSNVEIGKHRLQVYRMRKDECLYRALGCNHIELVKYDLGMSNGGTISLKDTRMPRTSRSSTTGLALAYP